MFRRILAAVLAALMVLLLLCGCGDSQKVKEKKSQNKNTAEEIVISSYKPDTFCPVLSTNATNIGMLCIVYDSLISLPDNLFPESCLAESWSVSENGTKWYFTLRKDVKWHDGATFSAEDVIYTVETIKKSENSVYAYNVSLLDKIQKNGDFEIEISLKEPCVNFASLLYFPIIKKQTDEINKDTFRPIGTGPYRLEDRGEGNVLYLVKNDSWWGGEAVTDCITVKMLPDNDTALYTFSSGSIDMTLADDMNWGRFVDPISASYVSMPTPIFHFLGINHNNEVLGMKEVRRTLSLAINRSKLTEEVMMGYATESSIPIHPKWFVWGDKKIEFKQSFSGAKKELHENGWEIKNENYQKTVDDKTLTLEFGILYNEENQQRKEIAEMVKQNLEELGIKSHTEAVPFEEYNNRIQEGDYEIFIGSTIISPDLTFSLILGENNVFGFENEKIDTVFDAIGTKHSVSGIEEGYGTLIDCFDELNPVVGLFFEEKIMVYNKRIENGITPSYFDAYKGIEFLRKEESK